MSSSFRMGRALSLGASTMFRNLVPFAVLGAVVYAPLMVYRIKTYDHLQTLIADPSSDATLKALEILAITFAMGWGLRMVLSASVTYGVVQRIRGQPAGLVTSLVKGVGRVPHTLAISIIVFILTVLPTVMLLFLSTFLAALWAPCGIIIYCMYYVAVPASVCERTGVGGSLLRSRDLTSGHKSALFGLVAIIFLIDLFASKIVTKLFESSGGHTAVYVGLGVDIVIGILGACVASACYCLLRNEKEGTSADDLASVFD